MIVSISAGILLANGVAMCLGGALLRKKRQVKCRILYRRPYPPVSSGTLVRGGKKISNAVIDWEPSRETIYRASNWAFGLVFVGGILRLSGAVLAGGLMTSFWFYPSFRGALRRMRAQRRPTFGGAIAVSTFVLVALQMNLWAASGFNLYQFGRRVSKLAKRRSRILLAEMAAGKGATAWVLCEGVEIAVPFRDLREQDLVVVKDGDVVPIDGLVVEGEGSVNQHLLSPEREPISRSVGETVLASSRVESGQLMLRKVLLESDQ